VSIAMFRVSKKTHVEKPGGVHSYKVEFKSKDGHKLTLDVAEPEFDAYMTGDSMDVKWGDYQRKLGEVARS
jgi:hypothetical protein